MICEELTENGRHIHHQSDAGTKILQNETGIIYDNTIDIVPYWYTYNETDKLIVLIDDDKVIAFK